VFERLCFGQQQIEREIDMKTTKQEVKKETGDEIIEALLAEYGTSYEDIFGDEGLMARMKKRIVEKALLGELEHHLGFKKREKPEGTENCRNGYSKKQMIGEEGKMEIKVPRDREGSFEPILIKKGEKRFGGFDEKIIGMYARGMTVREIRGFIEEQYNVEVGSELISRVTESVMEEAVEWQNRPLERVYAVVFFDALRVKVRVDGAVKNHAVHLALGVGVDGSREILGIWCEKNEGAKFWMRVMNEIKNRGVEDILIAAVDGLKGFPEAIGVVYPETQVQTCIVHLTRHSLSFCSWQDRKKVANELKEIYRAGTEEIAEVRLEEFAESDLGKKYPMIAESWRKNWNEVIPFYSYPEEIRKMIYTTNAIESVNMQLRKIIKNRGHFPSEESATKLIYLALRNIGKKWANKPPTWGVASLQFAIMFGERFKK